MQQSYEKLTTQLKENGLSVTSARQAIFHVLYSYGPLSMNELIARVQKSHLINRASIYRTIDTFVEIGAVHRITIGWKYKLELSDDYHTHHHHLTCDICGNTEDIHESDTLLSEFNMLATSKGYSNIKHSIELRGICNSCNKK